MNSDDKSYCGCCGVKVQSYEEWCDKCIEHISKTILSSYLRTYFAQFNKPCPFQI